MQAIRKGGPLQVAGRRPIVWSRDEMARGGSDDTQAITGRYACGSVFDRGMLLAAIKKARLAISFTIMMDCAYQNGADLSKGELPGSLESFYSRGTAGSARATKPQAPRTA